MKPQTIERKRVIADRLAADTGRAVTFDASYPGGAAYIIRTDDGGHVFARSARAVKRIAAAWRQD